MQALKHETERFLTQARERTAEAHSRAALQILCGIDIDALSAASAEEAARLLFRIDRAIERERLKGLRRHWSYDLNRHIALKQLRDRLRTGRASRKPPHDTATQAGTSA